jgi:hypothetical protein
MEFGKEVREALVAATRGKTWSAVEGIDWGAADYRNHTISQPEHCKYQFLAHTEGQYIDINVNLNSQLIVVGRTSL